MSIHLCLESEWEAGGHIQSLLAKLDSRGEHWGKLPHRSCPWCWSSKRFSWLHTCILPQKLLKAVGWHSNAFYCISTLFSEAVCKINREINEMVETDRTPVMLLHNFLSTLKLGFSMLLNHLLIILCGYSHTFTCSSVFVSADTNTGDFHFRGFFRHFFPLDICCFRLSLKRVHSEYRPWDTAGPMGNEIYRQHGLHFIEFINILYLCHDSSSEKQEWMKPFTITTTKWFPFLVKQRIYRAEQTKLTKVQGIR